MREILFRGKSINDNEWVFGDLIRNLIYDGREKEMRIGDIYFEHNGDIHGTAVYKVIPETVGQFTGLTDKNGKKIFEGDIIQYCGFGYRESMGTIIYDKNFGAFVSKEHERCYVRFGDISQYGTVMGVDVIGNIHDNPELLEQL